LEQQPSLDELTDAFPAEWRAVEREVGEVLEYQDTDRLVAYIKELSNAGPADGRRRDEHALLSAQVRRQIAVALLRQFRLSAATGVTEGRIRFNLVNGKIVQRLLFAHDLERKPASLRWFRVMWPLVSQKRFLMPLVEREGIYCFYSKALIRELVQMIGDRRCLEIAAGDGTLTRFLVAEGTDVIATDDHSWSRSVTYPPSVLRMDAAAALRRYEPEVVVCSWPPPENRFEREVFRTPSVDSYIVIGCRSEFNAGNWADYRKQTAFTFTEQPALSWLVLPPEIDPVVLVFGRERRPSDAEP
jgi:hypothetical protein